jgi:hypothetical protein
MSEVSMNKEKGRMKMHQETIKRALSENILLKKLVIYHEHIFDLQRTSIRRFVMYNLIWVFILMFSGIIFSKIFIYGALGSIFTLMIFLVFDQIFLGFWRKSLTLLKKEGVKNNAN